MSNAVRINQEGRGLLLSCQGSRLKPSLMGMGFIRVKVAVGFTS